MANPKKRVELRLEIEDCERLEELSRKRQQSTAQVLREALNLLYRQFRQEERLRAIKHLADLNLKMPVWDKLEKEVEGRYEN